MIKYLKNKHLIFFFHHLKFIIKLIKCLKHKTYRVLNKYPKISAIFLSGFITSIFGYFVLLGLSYFEIEIKGLETPYLTIFLLFEGSCFKSSLKFFFTSLLEKPLAMDVQDLLNTPTPPPAPTPEPTPAPAQEPAPAPAPATYVIPDPANIGIRGYINPANNLPYATSQPYARELAFQMGRDAANHGKPTVG
jgi:hypothetical protein